MAFSLFIGIPTAFVLRTRSRAGARVTPWRCRCGCPSFNFFIPGHPLPYDGFSFLESDKGGADPLISHPNNLNRTFNLGFC